MMARAFPAVERYHEISSETFNPIEVGIRFLRRLLDRGNAAVERFDGARQYRHDNDLRSGRRLWLVSLHALASIAQLRAATIRAGYANGLMESGARPRRASRTM
jgi:hypothetical protein